MIRLALLVSLLLAGCSESSPIEPGEQPPPTVRRLTYEVVRVDPNGAPGVDVIRYTGQNGDTGEITNLTLPWRVPFSIPADEEQVFNLEASVTAGGNRTGMAARIKIDGVTVSEQVVPGEEGGLRQTRTARAAYRYRPE